MSRIERFEEINAWQATRQLTNSVYDVSKQGNFRRDFGLRDQICRAAGSAMHNIAEGFDAGSDKEFVRFLKYARRSASEVQSQLYLALDQNYIEPAQFQDLYEQATRTKKMLNAFIAYLRR